MSKDSIDKLKALRSGQRLDELGKLVELYKRLTLLYPNKAHYWLSLGVTYLRMKRNKDGWKALSNAKKMGSIEAIELLEKIMINYKGSGKADASLVDKIISKMKGEVL
ncbi:MAG: hypothetical protein KAG61_04960 [Bacteriovoracaceae bacterium]|nr:hypothetical protein [Bacteriovoracaceae bacterium]